jgi:hypothetical protein
LEEEVEFANAPLVSQMTVQEFEVALMDVARDVARMLS